MLSALITAQLSLLVFLLLTAAVYATGPARADFARDAEEYVARHFAKRRTPHRAKLGRVHHI